jgi:hypothetical protein
MLPFVLKRLLFSDTACRYLQFGLVIHNYRDCTSASHTYVHLASCFSLHLACGAGGKVAFWADTAYTRFDFGRVLRHFLHLFAATSHFYSEVGIGAQSWL